ncbi:hypothetical protein K227x_17850 [Rubripirellula lacrimiformis]|uniref:Uncharacterized protein n=1 Tax=Rubripirellula lacrimiformis TaxID=1930273 RepID=A0A517N8E2_9BACT|nr:hypothetical protein [Rubripirellula lacrimiformis]QDT03403.1 hypothetical protein K227x_17850 [Rubripirellula lacrimiformis]
MLIRGLQPESLRHLLFDRPPAIDPDQPLRVFYAVCDHYEPMWNDAPADQQKSRVDRWSDTLPSLMSPFRDSAGRKPQHTFFYPEEEYRPQYLDALRSLRDQGLGDVEVHLHHDNDTSESLRSNLLRFTKRLHDDHGFLTPRGDGTFSYGFIHGNWTLDNSHPDGMYCGVNDELDILRETGCYADFTLPAAPSPAQTVTVNSIYYAKDDPLRPKSHDRGTPATVGQGQPDETLLMVQGPLVVDWTDRIKGIVPRIDYCNLQGRRTATLARLKRWIDAGVIVQGQPNWRFVKLHTHGCEEANMEHLLGPAMDKFHRDLADYARSTANFEYYYVTAREMAALVHQAEAGYTAPVFPTAADPDAVVAPASAAST